jgi:hypothetical protein
MRSWGSCLTWTAQRERASQLVRGMHAFYDSVAFVMSWEGMGELGVAKVLIYWALIHIVDPNTNYILNMAWYVSSL